MSDWRTSGADFFADIDEGVTVGAGAPRLYRREVLPDLIELGSEPASPRRLTSRTAQSEHVSVRSDEPFETLVIEIERGLVQIEA